MADLDGSTAVSGGDQMTPMSRRTEDAGRQFASAITGKSGLGVSGKVAGRSSMALETRRGRIWRKARSGPRHRPRLRVTLCP